MTTFLKSYEKKGMANMIMCRNIGTGLLSTSRQTTETVALMVAKSMELHPACIMLKWGLESFIDLALKTPSTQQPRA